MPTQRTTRCTRTVVALLCAAAVALGLASAVPAAGATTASPHSWQVQVGAQSPDHAIQTMGFYPAHLWVDQGDSVTFTADSAEIHTVSFLATASPCPPGVLCTVPPQGFNPGDPRQSTPRGGSSYDGSSYFNSGVLSSASGDTGPLPPFVTVQRSYRLTFPDTLAPGSYTYYCLVHGTAMQGVIIVQAAGTPYPFSQRQYARQIRRQQRADIADGYRLWRHARQQAATLSRQHSPTVLIGVMDDRAMVMRFIGPKLNITVGQRVTFRATSMGEPHTVTFGSDQTGCGTPPCNPEQPWNVTHDPDGNLSATYPGRNGGYTGNPANLNTGLMLGLPPTVTGLPSTLTVTFTQPGRIHYTCALHDYMGMLGTTIVHPRHRYAP